MKVINITILALLLVALSAANIFAIDDPGMPDSIRVGNLDGSHILANIGDTVSVPLWIKNDEDLCLIYAPVAIADSYINEELDGRFYGIFDPDSTPHWDYCQFGVNYEDLPVPGYVTYQAILISERYEPYNWLTFNSDSSWFKMLDFTFVINADTSLTGDTIQIVQGCNRFGSICELIGTQGDYVWNPAFVGGTIEIVAPAYAYLPGDANMFLGLWPPQVIGNDVTYLVNYFTGATQPCLLDGFYCAADVNGDCQVIGSDITRLQNYFLGGPPPAYCPDYPPLWPTRGDLPPNAPDGWPNCEGALAVKVIPGEPNRK
jgi:hypothetical protein